MPRKVFISYRRDDSAGHAGRVHDRLEREFGPDLLFMDVDAVPLGVNFIKVLREEVARCDVLLALIGPNWLNVRDEEGNRRLDNPEDFLRIEIATALQRNIPVIPILFDGARIPKADQLPQDLKELSVRNGLDIRHASFQADMDKLIRGLIGAPRAGRASRPVASVDAKSPIKVDAKLVHGAPSGWFMPGAGKTEWFKDHELGPRMVVVPAGEFLMGSSIDNRMLVHKVVIPIPFAVGKFAVTFAEWDACVADGDCNGYRPDDGGMGRDKRPVINVSWNDVKLYIKWLNAKTGRTYRLLSEAEREYVTRAGTRMPFWWGPDITQEQANYSSGAFAALYNIFATKFSTASTVPVDTFEPNPWGLFNVHGNVWEWCEDVWHETYDGAPTDGSAWLESTDESRRVARGGSWLSSSQSLRSAHRYGYSSGARINSVGFRLARTLNP